MEVSAKPSGIIVADDDPMICSVLRCTFTELNQIVLLASDGLEAVRLAALFQATLIVLDLRMPKLNGLLACEHIRRLPGNAHTPIVLLTSMRDKDTAAAGARVGATAFFTKPFRPALLLLELLPYLSLDEATRNQIRRNADCASRFADAAHQATDSDSPDIDTMFDRDKRVLSALRRLRH
jgi:CheY-like chemotaxis protein